MVVDSPIETDFVRRIVGEERFEAARRAGALVRPADLAQIFAHLHEQPRSAWSFAVDVRPNVETWTPKM